MTTEIELTQGKVALVDDEWYEWLAQWNWCAWKPRHIFYAVRNVIFDGKKEMVYMHRYILGLMSGDGKIADHINRNGLDNRQSNLRVVSASGNNCNHGLRSDNTSGHNGICWDKSRDRWTVGIGIEGKWFNLGRYVDLNDALESRRQGEMTHWQT